MPSINAAELSSSPATSRLGRFFAWRRLPILLFLVALLFRLGYFLQSLDNPLLYSTDLDEAYYIELGHHIAAGNWIGELGTFFMDPLYGYLLAAIFKVGGDNLTIVRMLQILLDSGNVVLIFFLAERLWNRRAAGIAALLYAGYKVAFFYTLLILKATLTVSGVLLFMLFLTGITKGVRRLPWYWLGLFLGLLVMLHANLLLLGPLGFLLYAWQERQRTKWWVASRGLLLLAGLFTVLSLGASRNFLAGGEWLFLNSQSGRLLYSSNNPENLNGTYGTPSFARPRPRESESDFHHQAETRLGRKLTVREVSDYWAGETWRYARQQPGLFLTGLANKLKWSITNHEIPINNSFAANTAFAPLLRWPLPNFLVAIALGLPGLAIACRRRRECLWLLVPLLTVWATMLIFYASSRFRLPAVPFFLIGAGIQVDSCLVWWQEKGAGRKLAGILLASLLLVGLIAPIARPIMNGFEELLVARAYWAIHDTDKAIAVASRGANLFPGNANFPILLGIIALATNDPAAAISANQTALTIEPRNVTALRHLAIAYLMRNQPLLARASLEQALALSNEPKLFYNLAETYEATQEPALASQYYQRYVESAREDKEMVAQARARIAALAEAAGTRPSSPASAGR